MLEQLSAPPPVPLQPLFNPLLSYQRRCLRARQLGVLRPAQSDKSKSPVAWRGDTVMKTRRKGRAGHWQKEKLQVRSPSLPHTSHSKSIKPTLPLSPPLTHSFDRSSPRPHLFKWPLPGFQSPQRRPVLPLMRPRRFRIQPIRTKCRLPSIQDHHLPSLGSSSSSEEELSWESYCQQVSAKGRRVLLQVRKPDSLSALQDSGGASPSEMLDPVFPLNRL